MKTSAWRRALRGFALALLFCGVFVGATVLHAGLPPGKRVAAWSLALVLGRTLRGSFEVGRVTELSPVGVAVDRFVARDPHGRVVLDASGVRAHAFVFAILRELLDDDGKTTIVVEYTRVERVAVTLAPEPTTGDLGIAAAFTPRAVSAPGAPPGRPVRLWLARAEIGQGAVRAELPGVPAFDGKVTGARGQVLVSPVGVAVDAERFSAVVHGLLEQDLRAVGTFHQRGTTHFWSSLDGYAGDLQFDSVARLDGKHLALTVDVPRAEPAVVHTLLADWPLAETVTAHVEAEGDLPELRATGTASVGGAALSAKGTLAFAPELRLALSAHGDDVDVRALFPHAPETRVSVDAEMGLASSSRGVELTTDGTTKATLVAGAPVPATEFHVSYGAGGLAGHGTLKEPGMPLAATFALKNSVFDADVRAPRFELARVPRLAKLFGVSGTAEFRAKAHVSEERLDATLALDLTRVQTGDAVLGSAHVNARASGPVARPKELRLDASLDGNDGRFGELRFERVSARASGPLEKLAVTTKWLGARGTSVEASTRVGVLDSPRFDDVDVTVTREGTSIHARAGHVLVGPDELELADVSLEGSGGSLTGSFRYRPTLVEVDARGQALDLAVLSRVLGLARYRARGKVDLTAELALARDVRHGTLELSLTDGAAGPVAGVSFELSTTLERDSLEGNAALEVAGFGNARFGFDTHVAGSLLEASAWQHATGRCEVGIERLELGRLAPLLPRAWQLERLGGVLVAQLNLVRDQAAEAPSLVVLAATNGLTLTRASSGGEPLSVTGIDAQLSGALDAKQNVALADLRLLDERGLLAVASARVETDVKTLWAEPAESLTRLSAAPVVATLVVDGRPLDELPVPLRPQGVLGTLHAELGLRGTLAEPHLSAKASVAELTLGDAPEVVPFDVCGTLQYDPGAARLGVGVQAHLARAGTRACSGTRVAVGSATATVDANALRRGQRAFHGEAQLGFEDLPLELVPPLAEAGMSGRVRGVAAITDAPGLPSLNARLSLDGVSAHKVPVGSGDLTLRSDGHVLTASVKLERAGGTLDADAHAALDWTANLPHLSGSEPLGVRAEFHDIDASILSPLVTDVLADLSGRLDGNLALTLAGDQSKPGAPTSDISGKLTLANGSLQIAGLGMRLSKLGFNAAASRSDGRTVVAVRGLSAASGSKYPNVAGTADLYFSGTKLVDARANVNLKRVPLMIQGVSQANLSGSAGLELFPERDPVLVAIQLHDLTAALPRSSGRAVLSVEDNPNIVVAQPLREPLRTSKGTGPSWQLAFDLAKNVRVTRADMEIPLRGRPVIELGAKTDVHGDLELEPGGRAQLLGKGFVIESGEVHFDTADPADPHLRVLASWRAPEGTTVYVEVGGTVHQATLRLESDPALPQADIQALLLGGGTSEGGQAQAAGLGYGADFVGQLLADTPLRRVELRTGTGTTADALSYSTYSAAVPVSENVWVELAYKNMDTTGGAVEQRDAASAIVDWRFKRDWSLRTEAGTVGTGIDMLWQYRY